MLYKSAAAAAAAQPLTFTLRKYAWTLNLWTHPLLAISFWVAPLDVYVFKNT